MTRLARFPVELVIHSRYVQSLFPFLVSPNNLFQNSIISNNHDRCTIPSTVLLSLIIALQTSKTSSFPGMPKRGVQTQLQSPIFLLLNSKSTHRATELPRSNFHLKSVHYFLFFLTRRLALQNFQNIPIA